MSSAPLPLGKIPPELLRALLALNTNNDPSVVVGPGVGVDCAVVEAGERLLVLKTDPITFATDQIGWYCVQVCANDLATTGARPRWFLSTLLLPEGYTTAQMVLDISGQIGQACADLGISVVGGHSEITHGVDRPLLIGTLIGETDRAGLVRPGGIRPGDRLLLTKGAPIEGASLLGREFSARLAGALSQADIRRLAHFLYDPGISVVRDARVALQAGGVTAMHDPTEGGVATALWELAQAGGCTLRCDLDKIQVPELARRACAAVGIDPLATIASGALLLAVDPGAQQAVCRALENAGIPCMVIGRAEAGPAMVWRATASGWLPLALPERDEIARLYESF
ncbi:MAG: AIR synthase [Chloroflexi bacterium]|nr:AIR synthase [Chloroflexota bacterium]